MTPYILESNKRYELSDCISCVVTEERNGKYEVKMVYDVSGNNSDAIEMWRRLFVKANEDDDDQEFIIYRITKMINGRMTIYGEHISYIMSYEPVRAFTITGDAASIAEEAQDKARIINAVVSYFNFSTDIGSTKTFTLDHPKTLRNILMGEEGSILQKFQGEWKFDNRNATLMQSRGSVTDVTIMYGKNITDITYDDSIASVYDAVYPYWFSEVEGVDTLVSLNSIVYIDDTSSFPYNPAMPLDLTSEFSDPPTDAQLRSAAESYIANNGVGTPDISINVNFVPLWQVKGLEYLRQLEKVSLCDTVSVIVPHLNIATNAKVVEVQYNVLKERYDSIKIGTVKKNFVGKISGDINDIRSVVNQLKRMR